MIAEDLHHLIALLRLGKYINFGSNTLNNNTLYEIMKYIKTKRVILYTPIDRKFEVVAYYIDEDIRFVYNSFEYELGSLINTINEPIA